MTRNEFANLTEGPVLLDGATGSNLMAAGMPRGVCTENWIIENPEVLRRLQRAYIDAGSQIIYAPTFGANRRMLASYGLEGELERFNQELVQLSKEAAAGRALVAGDLTTSGKIPEISPGYTYADALDLYREQIMVLAAAGVDLLVAETMISINEAMAAVEAAGQVCDLPMLCTMTVEADGSIFSGGTVVEAVMALQELGASAVGINCSVGPDQLEAVVVGMKRVAKIPVIVKPNAGMPVITEGGEVIYAMDAPDFARYMERLISAGADIVGGCCGTAPEHIRALGSVLINAKRVHNEESTCGTEQVVFSLDTVRA